MTLPKGISSIERGATYVFDKGYCDCSWWANIDAQHARFVTRFKANCLGLTHRCGRSRHDSGDQIVRLPTDIRAVAGAIATRSHPAPSSLGLQGALIAPIEHPGFGHRPHYKDRWQIELFFKAIKQNLKIKRFLDARERRAHPDSVALASCWPSTRRRRFTGSLWMLLAGASLFRPLSKLHATTDDENNASLSLNDSPDCSHEFIPDSSAPTRG
ncbi:MAG: hypothetical protein IPJ50_16140 [Betaproteobacteria bacterium]|nr:hypothetical protein [Betaproteobacteria bacterium]